MGERFRHYHPVVNFVYFLLVIGFAMAVQHPVAQGISLGCGLLYSLQCQGLRSFWGSVKLCLPLALFTALLNPLLNHMGQTALLTLPLLGTVTKESLLYGISAGVLLVTVLVWFSCFNRIITTDKFLFLFGRIIPGLALILSMTLRFVPRFARQFRAVTQAQKGLGRDIHQGNLWHRAKIAAGILSITVTWALENGVETADSMKSRAYGLPGRKSYTIHRFQRRDLICLGWLLLCCGVLLAGIIQGQFFFQYFPILWWEDPTAFTLCCYATYLALCATPLILNVWEAWRWNSIHSKM